MTAPRSVLPKALRRDGKRRLRFSTLVIASRPATARPSKRHLAWWQRTVHQHVERLRRQRARKAIAA